MTALQHRPPRRSLQARLALSYATATFLVGLLLVAVVAISLLGAQSTNAVGKQPNGTVASSGNGIGPGQIVGYSSLGLVVLVPLALLTGWFVAGRFLRPLRTIVGTAGDISAGSLDRRLSLGEPVDELSQLGQTLDDLFARLGASFDAQRHFIAGASHELRTPLSGQRTLLEVALADSAADADALRSVCREALGLAQEQERLLQALLDLAISEGGVTRCDTFDLADLARSVAATRRDDARARDVRLIEQLEFAPAAGSARLVETLVGNLIDNGIRHNQRGGFAEISVGLVGMRPAVTVTNSGPLVADADLPRLQQPFQRQARDRGKGVEGYGLGLAIVTAVAGAHRAELTMSARAEGGLCVTAVFPPVSKTAATVSGAAAAVSLRTP